MDEKGRPDGETKGGLGRPGEERDGQDCRDGEDAKRKKEKKREINK